MRLHFHWVSKVFLLLLFCICVANHAYALYDFKVDGIYYQKHSNTSTTVYVTYYITPSRSYSGDIVIPSYVTNNGTTYKVTGVGSDAFRDCPSLNSVVIPNTVTGIGEWAFYECTSLKSVNIPNSVTFIGEKAFYNCRSLEGDLTIPNAVTAIKEGTFYHCSLLHNVTIGNSVESIEGDAFNGCSSLETINVPSSVNKITGIGPKYRGAFYQCAPKKLIWNAKNCGNGEMTTSNIEEVTFGYGVEVLPSVAGSKITTVSIPNTVITIGYGVFKDCKSLLSVSIPNSVTSIGDYAFSGCSSLLSATIGNGVTIIGRYAFSYCSSIGNSITLNNVSSLGEYAFYCCNSLPNITMGNSITTISKQTFYGCESLSNLTIPASVATIEDMAFAYCPGLTSIKVNSGNSKYDSRNNCNAVIETETNKLVVGCQNTVIPNTVTAVGNNAFRGCTTLTSITIPNSVASIGNNSFAYCILRLLNYHK